MLRRTFLAALAPSRKPLNILFLLSDDQRADLLSCAGHPVLRTPNIDSIAQSGVRFTNNFCATAICCTSRASILTGLHEGSHKISDFRTRLSQPLVNLSYPHLLRHAGYRTGFIGKYGVGGDGAPPELFDVSHGNPGPERPGQTRELARQAIDFLNQSSSNQPFCLSVSFRAPHARDPDPRQYLYDPEEAHLYQNTPIPPPRKADYFERLPASVQTSEGRARWKLRFTNPEHYAESVRAYYRLIAGIDSVTGDILKTLTQRGLAENTVVIYSSDNGYFLGERGLADKWYAYEESIRTPLLIRHPHLRKGIRSEMTLNIDLSSTILELAGVGIPPAVQGRSLLPLLEGKRPHWRKDWFYSHYFRGNPPQVTIPRSEGIRTTRHKYIRWIDTQPLRDEVYDLRKDPEELTQQTNPKLHQTLENRWKLWRDAIAKWSPQRRWMDP